MVSFRPPRGRVRQSDRRLLPYRGPVCDLGAIGIVTRMGRDPGACGGGSVRSAATSRARPGGIATISINIAGPASMPEPPRTGAGGPRSAASAATMRMMIPEPRPTQPCPSWCNSHSHDDQGGLLHELRLSYCSLTVADATGEQSIHYDGPADLSVEDGRLVSSQLLLLYTLANGR